jgi:hypothetical protein
MTQQRFRAIAAFVLLLAMNTVAVADVITLQVAPAPAAPAEKKPARRRIVVAAPAAQPPAPQVNDAMVQQWVQQFRPTLIAELNFIRQVCDLTPGQRPTIRAAGEVVLVDAATQFARYQQGGRVRNGELQSQPFPPATIRAGLLKTLEQTLTPEQLANYKTEARARAEQRKRASILSVVARLDSALSLTREQREKLSEAITAKWREDWEQWLMVSRYGDQYFPQVPQDIIVPHLDSEQRVVWNSLQKIGVGFPGSFVQPQDDEAWWGNQAEPVGPPEAIPDSVVEQPAIAPAVIKALSKWLRLE